MIEHHPFGSDRRYAADEPVAVMLAPPDRVIDWLEDRLPDEVVWLPESLFDELQALAGKSSLPVLSRLNKYAQTMFVGENLQVLRGELQLLRSQPLSVDMLGALQCVVELIERANSTQAVLVEGP